MNISNVEGIDTFASNLHEPIIDSSTRKVERYNYIGKSKMPFLKCIEIIIENGALKLCSFIANAEFWFHFQVTVTFTFKFM